MKTLKLLFFSLFISMAILTSCTNDDVTETADLQESEAIQTALNHLRTLYNEDGSAINNMNPSGNLIFDFCFEFVYPINLIYNNGAIITINSNEELIEVLINSSNQLFIVGIEFPFDVEIYNPETNEVELLTITNETEFINLLVSCVFGNSCECDNEFDPVCVEITENNEIIIITFPNACYAECVGFTEENYFDCEGCECDNEYDPVCVEFEENGQVITIIFNNECEALCEGFTINDIVDCESNTVCNISELEALVGECNNDGTYNLTINFQFENTNNQEYFDLYVRNDSLIGYFPLVELPLTIEDFNLSGYEFDYIKVCINDNLECCEEIEWLAPDCNPGNDCYEYGFPIQMSLGGNYINVDNNEDVDYYLDLEYELVYPIELIINYEVILVFQGILEGTYGERCE